MKDQETNAEELYHKLGKYNNITMFDINGEETLEVASAVLFQFDYSDANTDPKIITVNLIDPDKMELIFSKDLTSDMDSTEEEKWYAFVDELRDFATTRFMGWKVHDITKARFDKNDFDFIRKNNTMESKMYGSKQSSYHEGANKTRLIIRHNQPVQEEVKGARSRNIKAIYIENAQGERFLMPRNHLPTARAMARHVANEGALTDSIGKNIVEMFDEMTSLRTFNRKYKNTDNMMEGAADILEATTWKYNELRKTLESLQKQRGYNQFVENFQEPTLNETDEEKDYTSLKEKLTKHVFDEADTELMAPVDTAFTDFENRKAERDKENSAKNIASRYNTVKAMDTLHLNTDESYDSNVRNRLRAINVHKFDDEAVGHFRLLQTLKDNVLMKLDFNAYGDFGDEIFNAVHALDFTYGKDDFMHKGIAVDPQHEKMGVYLYNLFINPKNVVHTPKTESVKSESEVFEAWVNNMVEYGEDEFEREKNPYELVASDLEEYAYKVGNTDMDYEVIMQVADHLQNDEYDEAGRIVNQMETEPREVVAHIMADHDLYDVIERWLEPMDSGFDDEEQDLGAEEDDFFDQASEFEDDEEFGESEEVDESIDRIMELAGLEETSGEQWNSMELIAGLQGQAEDLRNDGEDQEAEFLTWVAARVNQSYPDSIDSDDLHALLNEPQAREFDVSSDALSFAMQSMGFEEDGINPEGGINTGSPSKGVMRVGPLQGPQRGAGGDEPDRNELGWSKHPLEDDWGDDDDDDDHDYYNALDDEQYGDEEENFESEEQVDEAFGNEAEQIKQLLTPEELALVQDPDADLYGTSAFEKLFDYFSDEMPYGTQKARTGDPDQWIFDKLDSLGFYDDGINPEGGINTGSPSKGVMRVGRNESEEQFDYYESVQSLTKLAGIK